MPTFSYKALDKNGIEVSGTLEVDDEKSFLRQLKDMGCYATEVKEIKPLKSESGKNLDFKKEVEEHLMEKTTESDFEREKAEGLEKKYATKRTIWPVFLIIAVFLLWQFVKWETRERSPTPSKPATSSSHPSHPELGQIVKLKGGYPIAPSKELFDKAFEMVIAKDSEAFNKLASTGLVGITKEGVEVYVVNIHPFSGTAEVRIKGETAILWTNVEAVK